MENLNFYTVDLDYVQHLKDAEIAKRGFSRVPDMSYASNRKPKFLCGIVLEVNGQDYYVPVTSYKQQKPDNFLIRAANGDVVSSLRFNYMFPVPKELVKERLIRTEPDRAYRALLAQERLYCVQNQDDIRKLANRTYRRVLLGKDLVLVENSCDFVLLEEQAKEYMRLLKEKEEAEKALPPKLEDQIKDCTQRAAEQHAAKSSQEKTFGER